ncbi:hypothetical protein PS627_02769 [Pseudomonas fluorescens]|uniref:DUF1631 domain-containing protein n=1 Tax=Pseudomonas fluorescens TaxID=294 RepID=UPI001258954A|nr:DUF1631 domain-containing protein [Pseudomonas fluorescens]CAG8868008.1 hypothetical protein PS627_02769 [Pseudomonas fluorescens]
MRKEGNVVSLAAANLRGLRPPLPCLPVLLLQVRDKAALQLRQCLQALFDNADDTLFEMADKAMGPLEQHLFFEAMRDLRLKRKNIEREFIDTLQDAFSAIGRVDPLMQLPDAPGHGKEEQERSVAIQGMVERVLARDRFVLQQLCLRFQALLGQPVDEHCNPLGPARLCRFFLQAGRNLGVGFKVKLILLKLFERYVLRDIESIYGEANQLLAVAGVLPELKPAPRRRAEDRQRMAPRDPANQSEEEELHESSAGRAFITSLQPLLAPARGRVAPRLHGNLPASPIATGDLLRLLSHLQHFVPAVCEGDEFFPAQQLEQLLLRISVRSGNRRQIAAADEDLINLVGMLFNFILDDSNLPAALRRMIARLQIPYIKVALLDATLFTRASHPARRLLNEIALAAMGWEGNGEPQRDSLYLRIERIVLRLLNEFSEDTRLFSDLLAEFLTYSSEERRRNDLLEQRTRDAEEGRARTLLARQRVQQVLNQRLHGRVLPEVVVQILVQAWSQVLMLACLKHGERSRAWAQGLLTMDALLDSVAPHREPLARQQLLEQVPSLLKALREGLAAIALDSNATREFFAQLAELHLRACSTHDLGLSSQDNTLKEILVRDEIVLAVGEEPACAPLLQLDEHHPQLRQLQRLRVGSWVEVRDDGAPMRCKLIAWIASSDRFVFANRHGRKVRDWSRSGLLMALRREDVRPLDDGLLFDRALHAVVERLRGQPGL